MLFGKLRILGKLTLLVLVPLLGVLALAVPIVVNRVDVARDAQDTSDAVRLATRIGSALQELQEERLLSVGYLFGLIQEPELAVQTAKATDRIQALKRLDQPLTPALTRAIDGVSQLASTRANVLNRSIRPDEIISQFTAVVTPVIDELSVAQQADLATSAGRQVFALEQALRTDDMIGQAAGYLTGAAVTRNAALLGLFNSTLVQLQLLINNSQRYFTDAQYKLYLSAQEAFASRVGARFLAEVVIDPATAIKQLDVKSLLPSLRSVIVLGSFVEKRVAADVDAAVTVDRDSALRTAALVGGISVLLLLIVVALSLVMARAVARPLRRLTRSAERIAVAAEAELQRVADDDAEAARPIRLDSVDVAARDEIGDLARAFDRVQTTAAQLVERQVLSRRNVAQMFGHVGRRTQNLVGRQLSLIDKLERRETDSERLRDLYRLDHLSSRLGRNAGSLVVLSGGAGTNDHMAPLGLSDVVRLALGEIEDYTRVDVEVPEEFVVVPALVADLTLLLAELMENATSFSPPHTRVTITAAGVRGGARLAIVDRGLGLAPERLAEENARLTRRERLDLAPTEVLGLFVVGRLARRHGVEVMLTDTPDGGVTAWIDLQPVHLVPRLEPSVAPSAPSAPIRATVPSSHTEFAPLVAGGAARSVPGSVQPFDANVLSRATHTLEAAQTWNAFSVRPTAPQLEAIPVEVRDQPATYEATPVAGRFPATLPELPAAGRYGEPERPALRGQVVMSAPSDAMYQRPEPVRPALEPPVPHTPPHPVAPQQAVARAAVPPVIVPQAAVPPAAPQAAAAPAVVPQPRTSPEPPQGSRPPLRRRVPGSQLPVETGSRTNAAPPTTDDALAAREAFSAFEAGVSRAQWDVMEQDMAAPPAVGHPPLTRRVPGATLPLNDSAKPAPPAPAAPPLDPEAARALMEQFEYGVARALHETQPQHEGQPR
ncbi:sensor histidine kinase [Couchioplanes caeruleus]|uniref:histidine kinase n=2 Tax=Couchioplanes caeruleus TaxID=56438 RepID=A0A1K0FAA6_9ACTN|nr:nitrate- and nitrite sensing domain-containing protein [Couchioplanes caeruleus]OJF09805.1 histidine kinase [Couchioplanes caeruleus subsp. caeruleus]ROP31414.1 histidine kinase/DNA gyrase B/HSP90-like ATPase [Couchioplanes caeruleus]